MGVFIHPTFYTAVSFYPRNLICHVVAAAINNGVREGVSEGGRE